MGHEHPQVQDRGLRYGTRARGEGQTHLVRVGDVDQLLGLVRGARQALVDGDADRRRAVGDECVPVWAPKQAGGTGGPRALAHLWLQQVRAVPCQRTGVASQSRRAASSKQPSFARCCARMTPAWQSTMKSVERSTSISSLAWTITAVKSSVISIRFASSRAESISATRLPPTRRDAR